MHMPSFKTERIAWRLLHGGNKTSEKRRRQLEEDFKLYFGSQKSSIRSHVRDMASIVEAGKPLPESLKFMTQIHPRALRLIAHYGINQQALDWKAEGINLAHEKIQPGVAACFANARLFMLADEDCSYVEGIAMGVLSIPMLHAWNCSTVKGRIAYDWTWYATSYITRYLGVPFSKAELDLLLSRLSATDKHILFSVENFPKLETDIRRILKERRASRSIT